MSLAEYQRLTAKASGKPKAKAAPKRILLKADRTAVASVLQKWGSSVEGSIKLMTLAQLTLLAACVGKPLNTKRNTRNGAISRPDTKEYAKKVTDIVKTFLATGARPNDDDVLDIEDDDDNGDDNDDDNDG
jgi:hypothetical protein